VGTGGGMSMFSDGDETKNLCPLGMRMKINFYFGDESG